jgi:predicted DCC family thiol-disulfide oxidoreductase YuxK
MDMGIVVYDGDCGICQASARWIERHISEVRVVSHYEYGVEELGSVWFIDEHQSYEGAEAVARVLLSSHTVWIRLAGRVMLLPVVRTIAHGVYRVIAYNRRHISRLLRMNACAVSHKSN